jgi:phosphoribosyl-AMP cyclohydrolase
VQDHETGEVLMLAYINSLAWEKNPGDREGPLLEQIQEFFMAQGRVFRTCADDSRYSCGL